MPRPSNRQRFIQTLQNAVDPQRQLQQDVSAEKERLRIRRLVNLFLKALEKEVVQPGEQPNALWGEKETPLTVLTKLSQMLTKLEDGHVVID